MATPPAARGPRAPACLEMPVAGETMLLDPSGVAVLPESRALLVADLHLEKGSAFAGRRQYLPPYDTRATLLRLAAAIARHDPAVVVCLGDSFHDARAAARLPGEDLVLLSSLMTGRDWIWISGNHDPDAPAGLAGETVSEICMGSLTLRHEPAAAGGSEGEVAGHLHPGARVVHRGRSVRRACFATDGRRMILPAFGAYTGCLNILDGAFSALFEKSSLRACMLGGERLFPVAASRLRRG
ncbi:ligase-associated DNA damage response endonuclease PdeM [Zhengella sp. ZM62]|uniref:ligase-associated DNA damage response endonuclease PdeM n=1 Tax=Zhengella sedimenti TaxID=3390035 RepID=UPI003976BEAC